MTEGVQYTRNEEYAYTEPTPPFHVLSAAMPNAGNPVSDVPEFASSGYAQLMRRNWMSLLAAAVWAHLDVLILGAWGCGAFRNDPSIVSVEFKRFLQSEFAGRFRLVVIAIKDVWGRHDVLEPFRRTFGEIHDEPVPPPASPEPQSGSRSRSEPVTRPTKRPRTEFNLGAQVAARGGQLDDEESQGMELSVEDFGKMISCDVCKASTD